MEQTAIEAAPKSYRIGGRSFTALPVVARQEKWLWPLIKVLFQKGETLTVEDIFAIMGESITRIVAILLIPEGQTQPQKVRGGIAAVDQLESWLDETVSVAELGPVVADFFASGQQWTMFAGLAGPLRHPMIGSTRPSALSPTEISVGPNGSGRTSDLVRPQAISSEPVNAAPPNGPSLVSVA